MPDALLITISRDPLLVGGVALAIGAVIAASLPSSQVENSLFGKQSYDVKDKAREAVSQVSGIARYCLIELVQNVTLPFQNLQKPAVDIE